MKKIAGETITQELDRWTLEHGDARTALNIALARLDAAEIVVEQLKAELLAAYKSIDEQLLS